MPINIQNDPHRSQLTDAGLAAQRQGDFNKAVALFQQAVDLAPLNADSHGNLADALRDAGDVEKALAAYDRAIQLDPRRSTFYNNRGTLRRMIGRLTEAIQDYQFVIAHPSPDMPMAILSYAYNNLANALDDQGATEQAMPYYRLALQSDPSNSGSYSNMLLATASIPDFNPIEALDLERQWWARYASHITPMSHKPPGRTSRPLRVGLVSADFRSHSVAFFLLPLLSRFDRSRFHFTCYADIASPDQYTKQFHDLASAWRNIRNSSDHVAAQMIEFDKMDILLDLGGHTGFARLGIFAYKPAPIQVAYLGCPISTGSPLIDWRITDALADPPGMTDAHFSEKLWRLDRPAWCFRPIADIPTVETPPVSRHTHFTFGSFNNFCKVTPQLISLWAEILRNAPNSRLLLKGTALADAPFTSTLLERFSALGVQSDRILLRPRNLDARDHLAAYNEIDLALDTFPYNGTTTTCEALYMNVPVLTCSGTTHHSRVSTSLLSALNLPELIAQSPDQYKTFAIRFAQNQVTLATIRSGLRQRLQQSPLMNESAFATAFTTALRHMWRRYSEPNRR